MSSTLVILGGYGYTGRALAQILLKHSNLNLVLAGRHRELAEADAKYWNGLHPGQRVRGEYADASDPATLKAVFRGAQMVAVAAGVVPHIDRVVRAAIERRLDYLDFQISPQKLRLLDALEKEIRAADLCFVTDGGFHPGLPGLLVRHLARGMDTLTTAGVASVVNPKGGYPLTSGMDELMGLFMDYRAEVLRDGNWVEQAARDLRPVMVDFGPAYGSRECYPMGLEELRDLPQMVPGLRDAAFYVGGGGVLMDKVITPVVMLALKVFREKALSRMAELFSWGSRFAPPPHGVVIKAEAVGVKDGKPVPASLTLYHEDAYHFTAAPAAACIRQILCPDRVAGLQRTARRPGLHFQAHLPDTECLMRDLADMGIRTI
jgi:saccharopine dehydrogenase (NAD+, L-lysine-forming)